MATRHRFARRSVRGNAIRSGTPSSGSVESTHSKLVITLLFVLWYAEIALKALAAYRLYHTRLLLEFPFLFIFLIVSATKSTLLAQARYTPETYAALYSISVPVMLVLQYLCAIELFNRLTTHYPQFQRVGKIFLVSFVILGVTASVGTRNIGVPASWSGMREAAILLDRYGLVALFVGLTFMAIVVPRVQSLPVPHNARQATPILAFYVFGNAVTATILVGSSGTLRLLPAYVTVTTGLLAALGWLTLRTERHVEGPPELDRRWARRKLQAYRRFIRGLRGNAGFPLVARNVP